MYYGLRPDRATITKHYYAAQCYWDTDTSQIVAVCCVNPVNLTNLSPHKHDYNNNNSCRS